MKKKRRYENKAHLLYVASLPCMICGASPVQVHHLLKPVDRKRGFGMRSGDEHTVPLCFKHHAELHTKFGNEFKFYDHYLDNETAGQEYAKRLYEGTQKEDESDLPF